MTKRLASLLTVAIIGLSPLAACSTESDAPEKKESAQKATPESKDLETPLAGPGTYVWDYEGATGTVELPEAGNEALKSNPTFEALETYRTKTGSPAVYYVNSAVDNSAGQADLNMYSLAIITEDGTTLTSLDPVDVVQGWQANTADDAIVSEGDDLLASRQDLLHPGAKTTKMWIFDAPIESISRVYVYPAGGVDQVEATKQ